MGAKGLRNTLMPYAIGRYGALTQDVASEWNDAVGEDPLAQASWGANCTRLRELKKKYDPKNLFHINHNIKPLARFDADSSFLYALSDSKCDFKVQVRAHPLLFYYF